MVARSGEGDDRDIASDGRNETEAQRADRNFNELLQELRVAQTGVQILFAFLLSLPFTQRFGQLTAEERVVYLITLLATALATACLIAPVSHHRVLFRKRRKPEIVEAANRMAQTGLAFLGTAVVLSVYLIFKVVAGRPLALVVGVGLAILVVLIWYVQPLLLRRRG
jgi:putative flippase GtrA